MKKLVALFAALAATTLSAQTFQQAAADAERRLNTALAELQELEREISTQRPPLAAELDRVEQEAFRLRNEATNAARIQSTVDVEISQLDRRRQEIDNTNSFIAASLLNEYIRRFELTVDAAEFSRYRERIRNALEVQESGEQVDPAERFTIQLEMVKASLERMKRVIGGDQYEGRASVGGQILDGRFLQLGPISYFVSNDNSAAGITRGSMEGLPSIFRLDAQARVIADTVRNGSGVLPIDSTNREAFDAIREEITLLEEFAAGGMVMYPILTLFAAAILISIFKFFELASVKAAKERDLKEILDQLAKDNKSAALAHAKTVGGPVGELLTTAVENADQPREVIEEVLYEKIINTQPKLERFLPFVAVVAATAPLLGLLGTVTGMIRTFKLITIVGTGDARALSSGISEALITTKWGLIVAIPSLIMHALLSRKAKNVVSSMEQTSVGFVNGIIELRGEEVVESDEA
ncbi:MAG: DUF3450 family protein [Verrucomicrobia bacterium]|nr:DUF3450 family protein [Verrucomicrobiota bacterium]